MYDNQFRHWSWTYLPDSSLPGRHASRVVEWELDIEKMTATNVWSYTHPKRLWSWCCGGVHLINTTESDAPILAIGWGATDVFYNEVTYESEPKIIREFSGFSPNRVYLQPWEGFSNDPPRLLLCSDYAKDPDSFGELDDWTLHMAYNGVTGITKWRVYVDTSPETLAQQKAGEFLVEIPKQDFEETLSLKSVRQLMDVTGNKSIEYSGKDAICASRPSQGQGRNPHAIENDQSASGSL